MFCICWLPAKGINLLTNDWLITANKKKSPTYLLLEVIKFFLSGFGENKKKTLEMNGGNKTVYNSYISLWFFSNIWNITFVGRIVNFDKPKLMHILNQLKYDN